MNPLHERWRPVAGFEKVYKVSNHGNVYSIRHQRLLKPGSSTRGYRRIELCVANKSKKKLVGRLVLEAFIGPRPKNHVMCHGPSGKLDDSLENLSWGTRSKNNGEDKLRDGTSNRGDRCGNSKITWTNVRTIRKRHSKGELIRMIAADFPISLQQIGRIVRNEQWKESHGLP